MQTPTFYPKKAMARLVQTFLVVFLLLIGNSLIFAQNVAQQEGFGRVIGVVTDALSGETLPGANIVLSGNTSIGAPTNLDGQYTISRVPAGTVVLVARYLGFATLEQEVTIERGGTITVDFAMVPESITGQEIMVTAQAQGQQQAINQQINSDRIVNVVSESRIQELPDFNAAAALSRLPGVSTQRSSGEDNKVIIRGLSPEYNSIEIEGVRLSATGSTQIGMTSTAGANNLNNDRSVDLTMISPYMIRMISVYKSLTPDMNANSIGGTVNMELREAPSGVNWDALWQQGYTAKSNTIGNYRAVASASTRFLDDRFGVYGLLNIESYDRNADNLNAAYGRASSVIDPETGYRPVQVNSVTFNRHIETRQRYGGNLIMDYRLTDGSIKFVNMFARLNSDYTDHRQVLNYLNGGINWDVRHVDNVIDQQMNSLRFDYDFGFISTSVSASYTSAKNVMDRSPQFMFNQTGGLPGGTLRDNIKPEDLTYLVNYSGHEQVVWRGANLFSSDYKEEKLTYKADFEVPYTVGRSASGFFKFGGQMNMQSNVVDQETPYVAIEQGGNVNTIQGRMMQAVANQFGLNINSAGNLPGNFFYTNNSSLMNSFLDNDFGSIHYASNPRQLRSILDFIVNNPEFAAANTSASSGAQGGYYDGLYQQLANDYEYNEDYQALYAMSRFNWQGFMVIGGVRYERVESDYFAYNAFDMRNAQQQRMYDTTTVNSNQFLLPMVQTKYSPFEWMDIRYAYTETLARPAYSQISPKFTITQTQNIHAGNPELTPAKAHNHDISLTFHANRLGLFSVGAFHKRVENFVYPVTYSLDAAEMAGIDDRSRYTIIRDGNPVVSPNMTAGPRVFRPINNPHDAIIKGLEFDFQTSFWYMPRPLNGMVFGVNYTRIFSEATYPFYDRRVELVVIPPATRPTPVPVLVDSVRTGRLIHQPNHTLNSYLGYDYRGLSTRLSFLFQANAVSAINAEYPEGDYFTQDYFRIDFSARQKLPFAKSELFLDISNLNNVNTESTQRTMGGYSNIQNYGLTANIGIRIRT